MDKGLSSCQTSDICRMARPLAALVDPYRQGPDITPPHASPRRALKGLPESIEATWPLAIVQTCVLHLIRNTFRLASRADWDKMARDLRPVYTAVNEADAGARLDEFHTIWGNRYPAIKTLWTNAWAEFVPFLDYSPEIRRVIYSTNAIESLNARFRRATRARGHFPNEQAALKCLYMVVRSLDPKGTGQERWMNRWKPALNAFAITFDGRLI